MGIRSLTNGGGRRGGLWVWPVIFAVGFGIGYALLMLLGKAPETASMIPLAQRDAAPQAVAALVRPAARTRPARTLAPTVIAKTPAPPRPATAPPAAGTLVPAAPPGATPPAPPRPAVPPPVLAARPVHVPPIAKPLAVAAPVQIAHAKSSRRGRDQPMRRRHRVARYWWRHCRGHLCTVDFGDISGGVLIRKGHLRDGKPVNWRKSFAGAPRVDVLPADGRVRVTLDAIAMGPHGRPIAAEITWDKGGETVRGVIALHLGKGKNLTMYRR